MIENKIEKYLNEQFKDNFVDTKIFNNYRRDYLNAIKKAERQLEKDITLFVQKYEVGVGNPDTPDEIKQRVADNIEAYFIDYVPEHVFNNIKNLVDV